MTLAAAGRRALRTLALTSFLLLVLHGNMALPALTGPQTAPPSRVHLMP